MTRREQREHLFKLLFIKEFHEATELDEQFAQYVVQFSDDEDSSAWEELRQKLSDMILHEGETDVVLSAASSGWKLSRMGKAELAIMRIAAYEILFDTGVPKKVAVNEAVELAKKYGNDSSGAFVNGVLAKLMKDEE